MIRYLELPREERGEYVREAAARLGIQPVIIEKDLWVCWILGRTFSMPEATSRLVFKGGTSLSKVFGAIQRFSEDIDLGVSPQTLGWNESELEGASSRNQRDMRMDHLENDCARWVDGTLRPELEAVIREGLGLPETSSSWLEFVRDPATKAPVLNFTYPSVLPPETGYISPWVKLEFGSLTDQQPRGAHIVRTMLAEALNEGVEQCDANVTALEIERTFWEKATILHTEHHRPGTSAMRDRYARHYSDFAALWNHPTRNKCVERLDLLDRVARHKSLFFGSAWASYDAAKPGTLKLVPPEFRLSELARDYEKMKPMFLKDPPTFAEILETIADAEQFINEG
jgi:hypothetical protein